jgi:hypothetical protein
LKKMKARFQDRKRHEISDFEFRISNFPAIPTVRPGA